MELNIYWTQLAEDKLEDIFYYYKGKAGINTARELVRGIISLTANLDKNPSLGQREELLANREQTFRYLIYKNYKVIYWVDEERQRIIIANVFDCRQNPTKLSETR